LRAPSFSGSIRNGSANSIRSATLLKTLWPAAARRSNSPPSETFLPWARESARRSCSTSFLLCFRFSDWKCACVCLPVWLPRWSTLFSLISWSERPLLKRRRYSGAPIDDAQQCVRAVDSGGNILLRLDQLNAAGAIPPTRIGIGLHMGEAVTGNVGSNDRKEYTIIGDIVNLASRLEQVTKQLQARLLISEAVPRNLDDAATAVEDLGLVEL